MNRLRNRLILIFLAATLVPVGLTFWMTTSLLQRSLQYASTEELDKVSNSLKLTAREFYHQARQDLKDDAASGRLRPETLSPPFEAPVQDFVDSGDRERFLVGGDEGNQIRLLEKHGSEIRSFSRKLEGPGMNLIADQIAKAREIVENSRSRDLRRGFTYTYFVVTAAIWLGAFLVLIYSAHRISSPIQDLTAGLRKVAGGDLDARVRRGGDDEVGKAIEAFHYMADELKHSRERLIYLTRIASWQTLARKMAHEVKNSLTPIRLTMEEVGARFRDPFLEQASQIVVDEVSGLERRVRAFSQFAAEPPVQPEPLDLNALVEERIAFLKAAHPEVAYRIRLEANAPRAMADPDLVKGILTNLLENAAQAVGAGGTVQASTGRDGAKLAVDIQDSGPGLSEEARASLFEPTISFKKGGMGLGLSIARRSALLSGGDIVLMKGELGGAAFRLTLPPV